MERMDPILKIELFKSFPKKNDRRCISQKTMKEILIDTFDYGYQTAFDDIIKVLKDPNLTEKDLIMGEIMILAKNKMESLPIRKQYYKARSMTNIFWLLNYFGYGEKKEAKESAPLIN